jgi:hypothetical protein
MAPGKTFFSLGSSKQRRAPEQSDQKQQDTSAWERPVTGLYQRSSLIGEQQQEEKITNDAKHAKDQDRGPHEAKRPSLFKQLFQKCESCFATLDLQQCLPSAHAWHCECWMNVDMGITHLGRT